MKLWELLRSAKLPLPQGNPDVLYITENSKKVKRGTLFFAIKGYLEDGNTYIEEAVKRGAVAVVTDSAESFERYRKRLPTVHSTAIRKDLAVVAYHFYKSQIARLNILGVTGTNGKTTTTYLLFHALNRVSGTTGMVSTVECGLPENLHPSKQTTPSATALLELLAKFTRARAKWAVCEVSSHGLELHRVTGIKFKGGVFTNLSQDHLDFHKDMLSYFSAKEKLLLSTEDVCVVNADDSYGRLLLGLRAVFPCRLVPVGRGKTASLRGFRSENGRTTVELEYKGKSYTVETSLVGSFNALNVALAFTLLAELGISPTALRGAFKGVTVPGRMEQVAPGVYIDYAHTPDALKRALVELRKQSRGRLIAVFGCGGNRDSAKRPIMGRVAEKYSDIAIVTTDNPRNEPPESIIADILKGMEEEPEVVLDRREAIFKALSIKNEGDVVLIAGKGHETYQEVNGRRIPFSDKEVVREFYEAR